MHSMGRLGKPEGGEGMEEINLLADTWGIMQRAVLFWLDNIPEEALAGQLLTGKGRSVGRVFAHVHNTRIYWLEARGREFLKGLEKIEVRASPESAHDKALLRRSLEASGAAVGRLLEEAAQAGEVKSFKRSPTAYLGYAIAHESYHLGEIGIMLDQSGNKLDDKITYALWNWDKL